jgi:hypothetical protein
VLTKQLYLIRDPDALLTFEKSRLEQAIPSLSGWDSIERKVGKLQRSELRRGAATAYQGVDDG